MNRRPSLTLVELVAVLAVATVLLCLLLPAVLAARRSACLAHCQSNLRDIGLALHAHAGETGRFPQVTADPGAGNWITSLSLDEVSLRCPAVEPEPGTTCYVAVVGERPQDEAVYGPFGKRPSECDGTEKMVGERPPGKFGDAAGGFGDVGIWLDGNPMAWGTFGSRHGDGSNWLMEDGSVRWIAVD